MRELTNVPTEDLEKELERRKTSSSPPEPLEDPDFSTLRKTVVEGVRVACEQQYEDEDFQHYVYEAAVEAVYGKGFWKWWNARGW